MTTEFDQVFDQMEAPEYPATCDNCGEVETNATMGQHECQTVIKNVNNLEDARKRLARSSPCPVFTRDTGHSTSGWCYCGFHKSEHVKYHDAPAAPERDDDGVNRYLKSEIEHLLKENSTLIAQRERLLKAAQFLLAMNATNYDRDAMRSEGGFEALQKAVDEVAKEARAAITTSEQEGR